MPQTKDPTDTGARPDVVVRVPGPVEFATAWSAADPSLSHLGSDALLELLVFRASMARTTPNWLRGRLQVMTICPDGYREVATFPPPELQWEPHQRTLDAHYRPYLVDLLTLHQPQCWYSVDVFMTSADSLATLIAVPDAGILIATDFMDPFPGEEVLRRVSAAWGIGVDRLRLIVHACDEVLPWKRVMETANLAATSSVVFEFAFDSTMGEGLRLLAESLEYRRTVWMQERC